MANIYLFRRKTAADWTAANPVLMSGELGLETDTTRFKFGNGTTAWNSLAYAGASVGIVPWGAISGTLTDQTDLVAALATKQANLVSATNIKTINGASILGAGDLVVSGGATNLGYVAGTRTITSDTGTDAVLPLVTSGDAGLAPASGGGTTNFLRADGTWAAPPGGGGISDGDKGDITVSGSGAAWTIDNGVVTLAKMADMATSSLIYRKTAGTGAPEVQSLATLKTDLGLSGTNTGDQTITLTGDVTGTGTGSFAATIANGAVTYAKMQATALGNVILGKSGVAGTITEIQLGTNQFLGRGAGNVTTIGIDATLTITGSTLGVAAGTYVTVSGFDAAVAATPSVTANTAKVSNATHTGDVTGATALTIDKTAITGKTEVTAEAGVDYMLISDTSDSGNLKKALVPAGGGGVTSLTSTSTGTQNDWSPGTLGADTIVSWSGASSLLVTGLAGGSSGYRLAFRNGATNRIAVFALSNTGSSAANRFSVESRDPVIVLPGETAVFLHNGSNWLLTQAPSGGPRDNWNEFRITPGASGSYGVLGTTAFTNGGTAGTAGLSNPPTTFKDSAPRQTWATGAGAGTVTGVRTNPTVFHRSATAGIGGGFGVFVWSFDTLPASAETWFVGFGPGTIGPSNQDASARTEQVGWGRDPADSAQVRLMHNDSAGTSTKTDLGATFPENTTAVFGGAIWMAGNSDGFATVLWRRDDVTVTPSVNDVTTNIPTANLMLQPIIFLCNRAAAANYVISSHQPMRLWGP